jgi:hypothetical protein
VKPFDLLEDISRIITPRSQLNNRKQVALQFKANQKQTPLKTIIWGNQRERDHVIFELK